MLGASGSVSKVNALGAEVGVAVVEALWWFGGRSLCDIGVEKLKDVLSRFSTSLSSPSG